MINGLVVHKQIHKNLWIRWIEGAEDAVTHPLLAKTVNMALLWKPSAMQCMEWTLTSCVLVRLMRVTNRTARVSEVIEGGRLNVYSNVPSMTEPACKYTMSSLQIPVENIGDR